MTFWHPSMICSSCLFLTVPIFSKSLPLSTVAIWLMTATQVLGRFSHPCFNQTPELSLARQCQGTGKCDRTRGHKYSRGYTATRRCSGYAPNRGCRVLRPSRKKPWRDRAGTYLAGAQENQLENLWERGCSSLAGYKSQYPSRSYAQTEDSSASLQNLTLFNREPRTLNRSAYVRINVKLPKIVLHSYWIANMIVIWYYKIIYLIGIWS